MCIVTFVMASMHHQPRDGSPSFSTLSVDALLSVARHARRRRAHPDRDTTTVSILDAALHDGMPPVVDLAVYLCRVATLAQMEILPAGELFSSICSHLTSAFKARVIAVSMVEMLAYATACASDDLGISVKLAVGIEQGYLVVAVAIDTCRPAGNLSATRGLSLARSIVEAADGVFERGFEGDTMMLAAVFVGDDPTSSGGQPLDAPVIN